MIGRVLFWAAVLMVSPAAAVRLDPEWAVVFPAEMARTVLKQCSRTVPDSVQDAWLPTPELIRQGEVALAPALQQELDKELAPASRHASASDYYGQYAGLGIDGTRVVYINRFHRTHLALGSKMRPPRPEPDWRSVAINVCDGWPHFFGAEYDPMTGRVRNIHFNGRAG